MADEQLTIDDLPLLGAADLKAAYEAGRLDVVLGRQPSDEDQLLAKLRQKLPPRPSEEQPTTTPPPPPAQNIRSGSAPAVTPTGDPLERELSQKLGIHPSKFKKGR